MAKQIEVKRVFNASVEMVWKLWVEPELVKRWWGPKHFIAPMAEMDFRVGGRSLVSMQAPAEMGNKVWYSVWEYVTIEPLQKIEFIQNLADKDGNKTDPVKVGMPPDFPTDIRTVVNFYKLSDTETEMTIIEYAEFASMSNFAQIGLEQSVEKMAAIFE